MSHARLSPSSAGRWTKCPGSIRLIEARDDIEDHSGFAAEEGTAAHEVLELCLLEDKRPEDFRGQVFNKCEVKPDGFEVDDDMIENLDKVYDWVMDYKAQHNAEIFAERKVYPDTLFGRDDCHGTADVTFIHDRIIHIADLKYGAGVLVEVKNNLQCILYGIGVYASLTPEQRKNVDKVVITVMQPRIEHADGIIRSISYSVDTLFDWILWFKEKADATDDPEAHLNPGTSQCFFCPVKTSREGCRALKDKMLEVFDVVEITQVEDKVLRSPDSLTPEERTLILDNADIIEGFIKAVKASAQKDLERGIKVPGFKLVRGKKGNRSWADEDEVQKVARSLGITKANMFDSKLKSVPRLLAETKKAKKVTPEKLEKLNELIVQPEGKLVMAPESDPREPANTQRIEDAFKDVNIPETN